MNPKQTQKPNHTAPAAAPNTTQIPQHKNDPNNVQLPKKKPFQPKPWQIILTAVAGLVLLVVVSFLVWFIVAINTTQNNVSINGEIIEISPNSKLESIASQLKAKNLIGSEFAFVVYAKLGSAHGQLIPGPYLVKPTSSIVTIVSDMAAGKTAVNKITYPEGITREDMAKRYQNADYGTKEDYLSATTQLASNYSFIPQQAQQNPEGFLFPATYQFKTGSPATELVKKQYEAFQTYMLPVLSGNKPAGLNEYQVLILASIVEKEAVTEADRKLVAGVFLNRMRAGMKLESDVTINYYTKKTITSATDLSIDTPYNSYKYQSLPPTPINNPSVESVQAVMNPTNSEYIFFIAGKDGKLYFATNLAQHNENIKNHL